MKIRLDNFFPRVRYRIEREFVRAIAAFDSTRRLLARKYSTLTWEERAIFQEKFARLFRKSWIHGRKGTWRLRFAGKELDIPLDSNSFALDWETAVSILGHDLSVKQTYERLVAGEQGPTLFVDVGANFGTHSLLFLVSGIETLTFEPNSACHPQFLRMCSLNGVTPRLQPFALGPENSRITLSYPAAETWLGSSTPTVVAALKLQYELISVTIEQKRLDDFLPSMRQKKVLIKIDTEGNELAVLEGAVEIMREIRPVIIFESWPGDGRSAIHSFFRDMGYGIQHLPWDGHPFDKGLSFDQFETSQDSNFVALTPETGFGATQSSRGGIDSPAR